MSSEHDKLKLFEENEDIDSDEWQEPSAVMMKADLEGEFSSGNPNYLFPDKNDKNWLHKAQKPSITHTRIKVLKDMNEQVQIRRWVVVPSSKLDLSNETLMDEAGNSSLEDDFSNTVIEKNKKNVDMTDENSFDCPTESHDISIFNTDESSASEEVSLNSEEGMNLWASPVSSEEKDLKNEMLLADQYIIESLSSLDKMQAFVALLNSDERKNILAELTSCRQKISRVQALFFVSRPKIE